MSVDPNHVPSFPSVFRRQLAICAAFALLLGFIVGSLYWQERRREWALHQEQAKHRLDIAAELISREIDRVRADVLFLADQAAVHQFVQGDESRREDLQSEYANFVQRKRIYDQIRLLDLDGRESIRVNLVGARPLAVEPSELQDKSDRYYFQAALSLRAGDIFVSDFDLNLEHGQIERPLKPVIRFVTPVLGTAERIAGFLVLNYLGAPLLRELDDTTLPGCTLLLRSDGNYVSGPSKDDAWGWLLGHERTFASQFPAEWAGLDETADCRLTPNGAFAATRIVLGTPPRTPETGIPADILSRAAKEQTASAEFADCRGLSSQGPGFFQLE